MRPIRLLVLACSMVPLGVAAADDVVVGYVAPTAEAAPRDAPAQPGGVGRALLIRADDCVEPGQRELIEASLRLAQPARQVRWELPCPQPIAPVAYRVEASGGGIDLLPQEALFEPVYADPRDPRFGLRFQRHWLDSGDPFTAADVALGGELGLAAGGEPVQKWQLGIEAGVFALFNLGSDSNGLVNADYRIGIPLSYRAGDWSLRTRVYHQSSHLGDEYMLQNRGTRRMNLSYEIADALISYDWNRFRLLGGAGYMLHTLHDQERLQVQYGVEYEYPRVFGRLNLVLASFFENSQEQGWDLSQSYRLGLTLDHGVREAGIFLAHYHGYSPDGQFFDQLLRYTGIEFSFRL